MSVSPQKDKLTNMCEYVKNRLYFRTLRNEPVPRSTANSHFFCIDNELVYVNFYSDFGPLNLGSLYRYCVKLKTKLTQPSLASKIIVHCTSENPQKRANAAFLIASFAIIFLNMTPKQALKPLVCEKLRFLAFQDACLGRSEYKISLLDCLNGLYRAWTFGLIQFDDFDLQEYEYYGSFQNGDLNWIVPHKFLAFSGPDDRKYYKLPETYFNYFRFNDVKTIVRLNKKQYDSKRLVQAGFKHYDLFLPDGSAPTPALASIFLCISEHCDGAVAVHCKAGLGRTGSLIGAYLIKHYHMTAKEAIAWLRICRPGSVIGNQQAWLEAVQPLLWRQGENFRFKRYKNKEHFPVHAHGIYSIGAKLWRKQYLMQGQCFTPSPERLLKASGDSVPQCRKKKKQQPRTGEATGDYKGEQLANRKLWTRNWVPSESNKSAAPITQGDRLNAIKARHINSQKVGRK